MKPRRIVTENYVLLKIIIKVTAKHGFNLKGNKNRHCQTNPYFCWKITRNLPANDLPFLNIHDSFELPRTYWIKWLKEHQIRQHRNYQIFSSNWLSFQFKHSPAVYYFILNRWIWPLCCFRTHQKLSKFRFKAKEN